jgi:phosphopantothenoylcysteine synthetase/decarboxylase
MDSIKPGALRCLITAGPTREHLDPVRFFSNGSSGKMGYALAEAALERGWEVDLVSGPVALPPPPGARVHRVVSAEEMLGACKELFPGCDLLVMVAAVADYRPRVRHAEKNRKATGPLILEMEPTPDILKTLAASRTGQLVVGFAAETSDVEANARRKMEDKKLDWIVANDVGVPGIGMEADANRVLLLSKEGRGYPIGPDSKIEVARQILGRIMEEGAG